MKKAKKKIKIVQLFRSAEIGDIALTADGNLYRLFHQFDCNKDSDITFYKDESALIPIKLTYAQKPNKTK